MQFNNYIGSNMKDLGKAKKYKLVLIDALNINLKPKQFKRKGNGFVKINNDLVYYITLQSSQSSTSEVLKATINIEISSSTLSPLTFDPIHFRKRIGSYLDAPLDKWWSIHSDKTAISSSNEIIELLINKALPELELFQSTEDLANLWKEDKCPGLTDFQRKEYLSLLSKM
jgi:hypothetical protein